MSRHVSGCKAVHFLLAFMNSQNGPGCPEWFKLHNTGLAKALSSFQPGEQGWGGGW